jgi:glycine/D-amino acid oxidase-like deaminating enzyme
MPHITRKQFLSGSAAVLGSAMLGRPSAARTSGAASTKTIPGEIVGAGSAMGHRLRGESLPAPSRTMEATAVIVGGGIAGLGAAYQLVKHGMRDLLVLDLEAEPGGNAASGRNEVSAYPWGAHYVPLPTAEARAVQALFEDLGIITGRTEAGMPIYDEAALCAEPQERLWRYGRWQDGLVPSFGIESEDEADTARFFAAMEAFRRRRDAEGRRAFAIPLDLSSQEQDLLDLDTITMTEWLSREGYRSLTLYWYVDYCCRDDYGTAAAETSAWAGIHYFAARDGFAANADPQAIVTWPEGNGYLARRLSEPLEGLIRTRALAFKVEEAGDAVHVDFWDEGAGQSLRVKARAVVLATPAFVAARLRGENLDRVSGLSYAPWAVANITVSRMPAGKGVPLCWDNVVYDSALLGYVNSGHQVTQMHPLRTVLTYYWPLTHKAPAEARREALARTIGEWQSIFLAELLKVHPELDRHIERADVRVWGHAMVRPTPGFIWGERRRTMLRQTPPVFTAHSDMSGNSLFEEAYTHGVRAAENVLAYLGIPFRSAL